MYSFQANLFFVKVYNVKTVDPILPYDAFLKWGDLIEYYYLPEDFLGYIYDLYLWGKIK